MPTANEPGRIDTLLALALALDQESERETSAADSDRVLEREANPLWRELFSDLKENDRQAIERRAQWYARLGEEKQAQWVANRLARTRFSLPPLDEHVHPSHVLEALRVEPQRIRQLVLGHLPPSLTAFCASALGQPAPTAASRANPARDVKPKQGTPAPEIIALVRRVFLSNFVAASELREPIHLDQLSGVELVRLVRLLGVRETAMACRGIDRAEMVASFLRRLSAENARAVATHMATLINPEPRRVAFADQLIHEALSMEPEPEMMLDRLGMQALAITLVMHEEPEKRAAYISQKLPFDAALGLREMAADYAGRGDREMMRLLSEETNELTASLLIAHARNRKPPARRAAPYIDVDV
jgi:hypothetical protein